LNLGESSKESARVRESLLLLYDAQVLLLSLWFSLSLSLDARVVCFAVFAVNSKSLQNIAGDNVAVESTKKIKT